MNILLFFSVLGVIDTDIKNCFDLTALGPWCVPCMSLYWFCKSIYLIFFKTFYMVFHFIQYLSLIVRTGCDILNDI